MAKKNCWEVMHCGREPGGRNEKMGICPAAITCENDGFNNGERGGRFCWNFAGTFCNEELQGSVAKKLKNCLNCGFLKMVREEEGEDFILELKRKNK